MEEKNILCVTERLIVRRFEAEDLEELYGLLSDPKVMECLEPPYTYEQSGEFLRIAGLADPPLIYAVEDKTGSFVGYVIYHDYGKNSVELGWVLNPKQWGKGYAHELTGALLTRAGDKYSFAVIECVPRQEATQAIARKNGFSYLGMEDGCQVYQKKLK